MSYSRPMRSIILSLTNMSALLVAPHSAVAMPGAAVIVSAPTAIRASACYNVQDADAQAACLARVHRDPGRCYNVQRADVQALCLAEVRR